MNERTLIECPICKRGIIPGEYCAHCLHQEVESLRHARQTLRCEIEEAKRNNEITESILIEQNQVLNKKLQEKCKSFSDLWVSINNHYKCCGYEKQHDLREELEKFFGRKFEHMNEKESI